LDGWHLVGDGAKAGSQNQKCRDSGPAGSCDGWKFALRAHELLPDQHSIDTNSAT
jgi:hypothetical protein